MITLIRKARSRAPAVVLRIGRALAAPAVALGLSAAAPAPALAYGPPYAPLNRPGPRLSVPLARLRAALACTRGYARARQRPILLIPGTDLDPSPNYAWNYERAFTMLGWPYCTITLPEHATGDIQAAGEYIVYALRTMSRAAHRRVDILGYSQGGMLPRWAFRFWPDTRRLVLDFVALDPSNHGTLDANAACQQSCSPADWQQAAGSNFITALNSLTETFAGIDYTVIFSRDDEIVVPNTDSSGSSSLHGGAGRIANIRVQDICPADSSDHLAMGTYDPVGYALAVDAFTHPGPALAARVPLAVCASPFQPGVDSATFASDYMGFLNAIGQAQSGVPQVAAEPPLRCYVFAACPVARPISRRERGGVTAPARNRGSARRPACPRSCRSRGSRRGGKPRRHARWY